MLYRASFFCPAFVFPFCYSPSHQSMLPVFPTSSCQCILLCSHHFFLPLSFSRSFFVSFPIFSYVLASILDHVQIVFSNLTCFILPFPLPASKRVPSKVVHRRKPLELLLTLPFSIIINALWVFGGAVLVPPKYGWTFQSLPNSGHLSSREMSVPAAAA